MKSAVVSLVPPTRLTQPTPVMAVIEPLVEACERVHGSDENYSMWLLSGAALRSAAGEEPWHQNPQTGTKP